MEIGRDGIRGEAIPLSMSSSIGVFPTDINAVAID
jgi:hypothetical protein